MSSEAHADELIKHLNWIRLDGKGIKAHKEKVREARVPKKERRPPHARAPVSVDGDGFVTRQAQRQRSGSEPEARPAQSIGCGSAFAALMDLDDDDDDDDDDEDDEDDDEDDDDDIENVPDLEEDDELPALAEVSFEQVYDEARADAPSPV
eukprot:1110427-Prymnesium_polylepis.1